MIEQDTATVPKMRQVVMDKQTTNLLLQMLHCGCSVPEGEVNECDCRKIPKRLAVAWAKAKLMCDRAGMGGRKFSPEVLAGIVVAANCVKELPMDVVVTVDGAEMLIPRVGRPPKESVN